MLLYFRYSLKALSTVLQSRKYLSFRNSIPAGACENDTCNYLKGNRRKQYLYALFLYGSAWAVLRKKKLTGTEKKRLALLSIAAPLFDDLYDARHLYPDLIESLVMDPDGTETDPDDSLLWCFRNVLICLYKTLNPPQETFRQLIMQLMRAQEKSRNLLWPASDADIISVTEEKGGLAAVLIRSILDDPLTLEEQRVAFSLGFLAQLMDDLFDLTSDQVDGRATSACLFRNADEARRFFLEKEKEWHALCQELPFAAERKQHFVQYIHLLLSPVFVCLDRYENFTNKTGINLFDRTFQNPVLICDMEKWSSRFRLLVLASRNSRFIRDHASEVE